MKNYLVTIIEEGTAAMFKVTASSLRQAKIKSLAHLNQVDEEDIDLNNTDDMVLCAVLEDNVEDYSVDIS